jgi:hypothetical protein
MNKEIVNKIIKRQYTIMMNEEKAMKRLLKVDISNMPESRLDGLFGMIEQHLGIISHAQNKIILLQEVAEQYE